MRGILPGRTLTHIIVLQREGKDFMLKEGDGCDPLVSHVACGVRRGRRHLLLAFLPAVRPLALSSFALLQHLESVKHPEHKRPSHDTSAENACIRTSLEVKRNREPCS